MKKIHWINKYTWTLFIIIGFVMLGYQTENRFIIEMVIIGGVYGLFSGFALPNWYEDHN